MGNPFKKLANTMQTERTFSFSDIVQGRDASVRVTEDNMLVAVDLAMVMTGKDKNYAGQASVGHDILVLRRGFTCILHDKGVLHAFCMTEGSCMHFA